MSLVFALRRASLAAAAVVATACASTGTATPSPFPTATRGRPSAVPAQPSAYPAPPWTSSPAAVEGVLASARALLGTPYRFGGETPQDGFDCSGFVSYVAAIHGISIPRTVADQFSSGRPVGRADLAPGDLVFYSTVGPGATHVGIVMPSDGAQLFIHAPADGSVVRVERIDTPYWERRWVGARRVF